MNYTLHQLQVFLKIVESKSITKAAEHLNLTQPAVSIQLRNFQDQFEIPLTEVVGRKLYVTDFGKEIAIAAEKILEEVEAINFKTREFKGQLTGKLRISVVSTGKYVMPFFIGEFLSKNKGVELIMDVTNKSKVLESLENNEVDFSLVSVMPEKLKVNNVSLLQNKLFLVADATQKTILKKQHPSILEQHSLIYRENGSATRQAMEGFINQHNIKVKKMIELTSNEAVKQAVLAGLGCSVMPLIGIRNELQNKSLKIIPIKGLPIVSSWNLIWLKEKKFSPVAKAYLDYVNQNKEQIINHHFKWFEDF